MSTSRIQGFRPGAALPRAVLVLTMALAAAVGAVQPAVAAPGRGTAPGAAATPASFAGTPTARAAAVPRRNNGLNEPIYFVHGFSKTAKSDCGSWSPAINEYRRRGATGPLLTVAYYGRDVHCNTRIGTGGLNTSIAEIGRQLAWKIYNQYSKRGISVDAVGYSMGGLIIRSALTNVQRKVRGYPPVLYVEDVVTLSTPHLGAKRAFLCGLLRVVQCTQMTANSTFLRGLHGNPQSGQGTDWTVIGADSDNVVTSASATGMLAGHKVIFNARSGLGHGTIYKATSGRYQSRYWNFYTRRWIIQRAGAAPVVVARNANFFWRLW